MATENRRVYVICEGLSEKAYLQEINKALREKDIDLQFVSKSAGNGHFRELKKKWGEIRNRKWKKNHNDYCIWADWDLFHRNYSGCKDLYDAREEDDFPQFLFNTQNFEDFLSLHYPSEMAREWCATCNRRGHFKEPMHSDEYTPLFAELVPDYQKGRLPDGFNIVENVRQMRVNKEDHTLGQRSGFCDFLLQRLPEEFFEE